MNNELQDNASIGHFEVPKPGKWWANADVKRKCIVKAGGSLGGNDKYPLQVTNELGQTYDAYFSTIHHGAGFVYVPGWCDGVTSRDGTAIHFKGIHSGNTYDAIWLESCEPVILAGQWLNWPKGYNVGTPIDASIRDFTLGEPGLFLSTNNKNAIGLIPSHGKIDARDWGITGQVRYGLHYRGKLIYWSDNSVWTRPDFIPE